MTGAAVLLALASIAAGAPEIKPLVYPAPLPHHRAVVVERPERANPKGYEASAWAYLGASVADAISTEIGVRTDGLGEGNPFMRGSTASRLAVKTGSAIGFLWLTRRMENRKAALWIRIGVAALHGVVVVRNIQAIQGAGP